DPKNHLQFRTKLDVSNCAPTHWTLRDQDERRMEGLILPFRPDACAGDLISGNILQVVVADAAGAVQPEDKRVLFVFVVMVGNEQTVWHLIGPIFIEPGLESLDFLFSHGWNCRAADTDCEKDDQALHRGELYLKRYCRVKNGDCFVVTEFLCKHVVAGFSPRSAHWKLTRAKACDYIITGCYTSASRFSTDQ